MGLSKSKSMDKVRKDVPVQDTMPPDEIVRININVPKSVRNRWKAAAVDRETTITEMLVEAVEAHLSK